MNLNQRHGNRTLPSWGGHTRIPNQEVVRRKPVGNNKWSRTTSQTPQRLDGSHCCLKHMDNRLRRMTKVHSLLHLCVNQLHRRRQAKALTTCNHVWILTLKIPKILNECLTFNKLIIADRQHLQPAHSRFNDAHIISQIMYCLWVRVSQ